MANYGYKGWIKLWREEMHNPLYFSEPFTKWQAWIDLCLMADSEGSVRTSIKALKTRWLWGSDHKVRDFLGSVEESGQGSVFYIPNKGTLIRLNTDNSATLRQPKKRQKGSVKGAVNEFEEVIIKKEIVSPTDITSPEEKKISPAVLSAAEAKSIWRDYL